MNLPPQIYNSPTYFDPPNPPTIRLNRLHSPPSLDSGGSFHSRTTPSNNKSFNSNTSSSINPLNNKTKQSSDTVYETTTIRSAFAPTFTSLRSALPRSIVPGAICDFKKKRQKSSLQQFQGQTHKPLKYSYPEYMSSDYNIKSAMGKEEQKKKKELQTSSEPFKPGGFRRKLKHENLMDPRGVKTNKKKIEKDSVAERAMNHIRKIAMEGVEVEVDVEDLQRRKTAGLLKLDGDGNVLGKGGDRIVKNADGKLVEMSKKKKGFDLKEAFAHYDTDGSGSIDMNELMEVIKNICGDEKYEELTDEEKEGIVTLFDPNGDGQIKYSEFVYSFYNRRGNSESSVASSSSDATPQSQSQSEAYRYPYASSPYDESREYWQRQKKVEDSKILEGPFKGGGGQKLKSNKISYLPEAGEYLVFLRLPETHY